MGAMDVVTKLSSRSVPDTVDRFTDILKSKNVRIFDVIDQSAAAKDAGLELRATTLVIFGNPAAGTPVMVAEPMAALDLPLKVLVWDDEGQTKVSYYDPAVQAAQYSLSPDLARGLAAINVLTDSLVAP
ncbi:MAG: DUF302 domain-containing protein [Acidimicrobiales bacterium]|jgi:uncharacterized protein (DUF302 family)